MSRFYWEKMGLLREKDKKMQFIVKSVPVNIGQYLLKYTYITS